MTHWIATNDVNLVVCVCVQNHLHVDAVYQTTFKKLATSKTLCLAATAMSMMSFHFQYQIESCHVNALDMQKGEC